MKKIKYLLVVSTLFLAMAGEHLRAETLPLYFAELRSEITNQLTVASNAAVLDRKLVSKLNATLKTIDRNKTNTLAVSTKTLVVVAKSLNKTSISNIFDAPLQAVVDLYVSNYFSAQGDLTGRLSATYPGKSRASAQKAIDKLIAAINGANTNLDSTLATKALSNASKALTVAIKSVAKAEAAPAPAPSVTATFTRSAGGTVSFDSEFGGVQQVSTGNFIINVSQLNGTTLHVLFFQLSGLVEGVNNINLAGGTYTIVKPGEGAFNGTGGSAQITLNSANKTLSGTFTFNVDEQDGPRTGTVTGDLFLTY